MGIWQVRQKQNLVIKKKFYCWFTRQRHSVTLMRRVSVGYWSVRHPVFMVMVPPPPPPREPGQRRQILTELFQDSVDRDRDRSRKPASSPFRDNLESNTRRGLKSLNSERHARRQVDRSNATTRLLYYNYVADRVLQQQAEPDVPTGFSPCPTNTQRIRPGDRRQKRGGASRFSRAACWS